MGSLGHNWVMVAKCSWMDSCLCERAPEDFLACFSPWGCREMSCSLQFGSRLSPEPKPVGTLISECHPRELWEIYCCLQASKSLVFCCSSLNGWRYRVILGVWAKVCISYKLSMWIKCPLDPFNVITMKQACLVPGGGEQGGEFPVGSESTIEDTGGVGVEGEVKAKSGESSCSD